MRGIVAALMSRMFVSLLLFAVGVVHLVHGDYSIACIFVVLASLMSSIWRIEKKIGS